MHNYNVLLIYWLIFLVLKDQPVLRHKCHMDSYGDNYCEVWIVVIFSETNFGLSYTAPVKSEPMPDKGVFVRGHSFFVYLWVNNKQKWQLILGLFHSSTIYNITAVHEATWKWCLQYYSNYLKMSNM